MSGGTGGPFVLGHRCASSQNQQGAGPPLDGLLLWRQGLATLQTPSVGPRFHLSPPRHPKPAGPWLGVIVPNKLIVMVEGISPRPAQPPLKRSRNETGP